VPPYALLYRLGIAPWEQRPVSEVWQRILGGDDRPPPGRALDIGCGSGRDAVYLAKQGWQVTAVDMVDKALAKARERAASEGVEVQWVQADVGELGSLGLEPGYSLICDFGCLHGLPDRARATMLAAVTELAAPGALLIILAFTAARRVLLPRGIDHEEIVRLLGDGWKPVGFENAADPAFAGRVNRAHPRIHTFTRRHG
jgi:2-polyprenyl-3-methyl-5-hydroxy-6-metoxy-1,4-benzoquinol methylase